jgi:hypothetical protein
MSDMEQLQLQLQQQIGQLQQALQEARNMAAHAVATAESAAQQSSRIGSPSLPKLSSHFREYLQEDGQNTAVWNASLRQEVDRYGLLNFLDVPGFEAGSPLVPLVRSMLLQSMEPGVRLQLEGAMALSNMQGGVLQQHPQVLYSGVMTAWNAVAQQKRHVLQTRLNTFAIIIIITGRRFQANLPLAWETKR